MREAIPTEIEALFRRESGRLISVLTRILGPGNLELAEDVMQDAFVAAMREWIQQGVPDNPSAWLFTAARNRAIDASAASGRAGRSLPTSLSTWTASGPSPRPSTRPLPKTGSRTISFA